MRRAVVPLASVRAPGHTARVEVDEVGVGDRLGDAGVAAAPGEQRPLQAAEQVDVLRAPGADRPDRVAESAVEDGGEARAVLDDLLEHDVGGVETALRAGRGLLSILTTSAGRSGTVCPNSSGTPVSGIRSMTSSVVVVGAAVVVVVVGGLPWWSVALVSSSARRWSLGRSSVAVVGAASLSPPPLQAVTTRPPRPAPALVLAVWTSSRSVVLIALSAG